MGEMVDARRTSGEAEERYDLFSGLLDASYEEVDDGGVLNDDELIGEHSCRTSSHSSTTSYLPS